MGKKDKKKGKGAEKTALRTEKKAISKIKKDLASKGEDDIEKLIAEFQEQDRKKSAVGEEPCEQPSPRSGFNLCPHPDKDELLLFGGEFYNGSKTVMYNDLYFYNIKKTQWNMMQCSLKPPPRCSAQAVVVSQRGGQLWVFGGEFASPTRSQFYHYKDLWVFSFADKVWQQIKSPGGPSSRSGHRMVVSKKNIVVFGGFHESIRDYKYFNDVYIFNLESYTWSKIDPVGKIPSPRSGGQVVPVAGGRVLVYGGYSREKLKKDVDKGVCHTDMYYLQVDERNNPPKWKWVQVKPSGVPPSPRSGLSIAVSPNNIAYAFGGVHDEELDEENLTSVFHNDLFSLELENGRWQQNNLRSKSSKGTRKKRRKVKENEEENEEEEEEEEGEDEMTETLEKVALAEVDEQKMVKTYDDSIFTVTVGPSSSNQPELGEGTSCLEERIAADAFVPKARMNASLALKSGILYLYGGLYEEGDRQLTLSDFYSLDIHKLDEWRTIVPFSTTNLEWIDSGESESEESGSDEMEEGSSDSEEEEMETI